MATKIQIAKYALLPALWPRIKTLVASGFWYLALMVAVIYHNVGLLPRDHPYLKPENFRRFGLRHVVAEAGRNLVFSRHHIDQIVIYFTILSGLVILFLQFFLLFFSFLFYPAMASTWYDFFVARPIPPDQDMSFVVLDRVFGVMSFDGSNSFFESCMGGTVSCTDINGNVVPSPAAFPMPFHQAMHQMMQFYSLGIAFVAGIIIIYHVIAMIGETVVSGTPFGERFNKAWFVPRLIMFFALILPMTLSATPGNNVGISGAQFITLAVAKFGSNMATNAWDEFHTTLTSSTDTMLGDNPSLIARPNIPEVAQLTQFMFVVRTCMYAEKLVHNREILPYIVRPFSADTTGVKAHDGTTVPYNTMGISADDRMDLFNVTSLPEAFQFSRYGNITVRFGYYDPPVAGPPSPSPSAAPLSQGNKDWGYVEPTCGELSIPFISMKPEVVGPLPGELGIQENYFLSISEYLLQDEFADNVSRCVVESTLPYNQDSTCVDQTYTLGTGTVQSKWLLVDAAKKSVERYDRLNKQYLGGDYYDESGNFVANTGGTIKYIKDNYDFSLPPEIADRGWAGAALWYNKIAEINGLVNAGLQSVPRPFKYPMVMENIARQHLQTDLNSQYPGRFNPLLEDGKKAEMKKPGDEYIAAALHTVFKFWTDAAPYTTTHMKQTGNPILDFINTILGTNGLLDVRNNVGTHPLAMLSSMGKAMVDAALQNLFYGAVGQGIGEIAGDNNFVGALGDLAAAFFLKFGLIALSIGFMLYYILPFMPFIYYFFAFAGRIKSIFEAMVAMPLWALAHIKMDGNGLPGPWATNGYFLLFEIFLRPTLIIFGFLSSISIFAALVDVMHEVFNTVLLNITGSDIDAAIGDPTTHKIADLRGPLDEFFYTVVYAILVYMMALSSFKLIDQIPNNIMRWMGVSVATFREGTADPAGELSGRAFRSSQMATAQLTTMIDRLKGITGGGDRLVNTSVALGE